MSDHSDKSMVQAKEYYCTKSNYSSFASEFSNLNPNEDTKSHFGLAITRRKDLKMYRAFTSIVTSSRKTREK